MNKIYKVMYSKVKQCAVVVSEIAKSHGHNGESSGVRKHAALTAAVLIALGSLSFTTAFVPMTAEAATTRTAGSNFVGVERTDDLPDENDYDNYGGKGANGADSITLGLRAKAGEGTITIGDRNAGASLGSVYVGQGDIANPKLDKGGWATSIGYNSDATGYGSIALGSNAVAENSYALDSKGNSLKLNDDTKFRLNPKPDIQRASVAIGYGARADNGNIAIGSYSDASTDLRTAKTTDGKEIKSYLTDKMADSYVSVGDGKDHSETQYRRISNVADGASASDVATVGQLQALAAKSGTYKAGFGIEITPDATKKENTIKLSRNLGRDMDSTDNATLVADESKSALVLGGRVEEGQSKKGQVVEKPYGAFGQDSVVVGGANNIADKDGVAAVVIGGTTNTASAQYSTVAGGNNNDAFGNESSVFGGFDNDAFGAHATLSGGSMNKAHGEAASVFGGGVNSALGDSSVAVGGLQSTVNGTFAVGIAGGSTNADYALAAGNGANVTVENGTAIGYQATTDEAGTIAFGHDAGDAYYSSTTWPQKATKQNGKYYDANNKEISKAEYDALKNSDGTWNDYSKTPTVVEKTYDKAAYNRLVKVADGVDDHDVVVMEQLKNAKNDLKVNAGWGINVNDVTTKNDNGTETTTKNVISLNRNLGTNYGNKYGNGKVTFEADGENSLIIGGGAINDSLYESNQDFTFGAHAKDSILVGGLNNDIAKDSEKVATSIGTRAVIIGGTSNTVSYDPVTEKDPDTGKEKVKVDSNGNVIVQTQKTGTDAIIVGGLQNTAKGDGSVLIGGERNEATGFYSTVIGGTSNKTDGWLSSIFGGTINTITGAPTAAGIFGGTGNTINSNGIAANVFGGENNTADNTLAVVVGGETNTSSGPASIILGGNHNTANQLLATVVGGQLNTATGETSMISGGIGNVTSGAYSYDAGGLYNRVTGMAASSLGGLNSSVNGMFSTGVAGGSTGENTILSLAAGYQSVVTDSGVEKTYVTGDDAEKVLEDQYSGKELPGYYTRDQSVDYGPGEPGRLIHYDKFSTALGYQATADEYGTIAFGHDAGDESGYTYEWETLTDENGNPKQNEIDGTTNDYTKAPKSVKKKAPYTSAYYNRLVKVADGIDDHDVVVMEQLKQYAEKDASNIGNNIKVYKTDANGNVQLDKDKKPIEETDATTTAQNGSKDDWGQALGAGTFTTGTSDKATDASTSDQLVTGKTLYDYDKPTGSTNYVNANNTTGQNLSALDAQVKSNAKTLNDKTHNIKYYSVKDGIQLSSFTNSDNLGASAVASMAAGYTTGTAGIASTVVGSYSGVMNTGTALGPWGLDYRGATAVSLGTVNVNNNTDTSKLYSGVANSIVGQANMTTDSNAAIIVGAGNSVTNSYRELDKDALSAIKSAGSVSALKDALQAAVPKSGAQVMVMGGGNNVEGAYMSQVVGVGNTVTGADSTYAEGTSTQYNFVDGFQNELTNGKHDYIIGSNNSVSGDSINENQSNIVVGDNHTLNNKKNNVVLGSADSSKELAASGAVVIGHNADVSVDNGVALGSDSVASVQEGQKGYDPAKEVENKTKEPWTSTKAAVSVGKADGSVTRQITGVAAGTNDTDAVNVAQIKKLASVDASNIGKNFKDGDVPTNENAWGEALGTGTVTKDNKQLVTGGTVYNEVRPSKDGKYVRMSQTTGDNLLKLDDQVKTNTDKLSDVDSRSVKYDTKTENGKTVVDNAKITLAGDGGTTITNLKDGVNNSDAATVGQLNSKIAGVTYTAGNGIAMDSTAKTISAKAGNGITVDTNGINAKAGTGITVDADGINVNTGKHLSVNTNGQVDVGDNGKVAANDGNLVTGKTVYDALNGGLTKIIVGTPGKDGKDGTPGTPGTIGLVGPAGADGKNAEVDITIQQGKDNDTKGIKGANGVDGTDGITRIVYTDTAGDHQVATMEDGMKFAGDDGQTSPDKVIAKKLNNTIDIIGGANSKNLTEGNIGVNSTDKGQLKVQLAKDLTSITSISGNTDTNGAKITLDENDKNISVNGGSIKGVASNLTEDGKLITGSANNAASISDVQTLVQQGVDNGYTHGDGITIHKDGTSGKNVISVNQGDGLKFDNGKLVVNTGDGLTVDKTTKALKIKTSDGNLKVDSNGIGLSDKITIGSDKTKQVTIDGTNGEISGLTNTTWDSKADYSKSTKAATESQVDAAVKDAVKQAGENDIHVAAGSYAVNDQNQVSMNLVDKNNDTKGTVIITDVAKSSEMGDVSKLADGVKNAGGKTTTVVDAINNVNTSMNTKIGDQKYSTSNTSGSNKYVQDGDSITSAIGKLDGAVQQATTAAGQHSTVSAGSNITVTPAKQTDGHTDYQVALNKDITVDSVTAKTATTGTLTVNNRATIGGVTIANKTISGLDDTKIEKGSTNAVNAGTIWNELRPSGGTYINQNNTTAQNITNLDTQVKKNSDLVNSDGSTIKIGSKDSATKVDISDKNGSGRVVTGVVTDAADPTSAANVGYVNGVTAANTQQIYRDMNNAYGRLNNNINKAAAGSNALAALHPLDYDPDDKADFAVGYGHYRNANAAAVGAFYHPNENTMVNVGVSLGNGDPGFNAGVSFKVGRGGAGREAMSKTEMAKVINSQSKEIDALKKDNADKDKRIDALEQKMAEILAKLDKNGK